MAKYEITFSCGHTEERQLYGKMADRERKIAYFEEHGLCSECYRKQKELERQEANKKAKETNQAAGLPKLEGSEKQVAWAEKIRADILQRLKPSDKAATTPQQEEIKKYIAKEYAKIKNEASAAWWIENRNRIEADFKSDLLAYAKKIGM